MKLYAIFDSAVKAFMRPFVAQSHGDAIRAFKDLLMEHEHPVARHPEDYSLFFVASFNEQSGVVTGEQAPFGLGTALEYMPQPLKAVNDA